MRLGGLRPGWKGAAGAATWGWGPKAGLMQGCPSLRPLSPLCACPSFSGAWLPAAWPWPASAFSFQPQGCAWWQAVAEGRLKLSSPFSLRCVILLTAVDKKCATKGSRLHDRNTRSAACSQALAVGLSVQPQVRLATCIRHRPQTALAMDSSQMHLDVCSRTLTWHAGTKRPRSFGHYR